jgi:hypothetical protein
MGIHWLELSDSSGTRLHVTTVHCQFVIHVLWSIVFSQHLYMQINAHRRETCIHQYGLRSGTIMQTSTSSRAWIIPLYLLHLFE